MPKNKGYTMDQITAYLRMKGIPSQMIYQIRLALANDAVQEAKNVQWDRIYTSAALALRDTYHFGGERIMRCLARMYEIMTEVGDGEKSWSEQMTRLKDETGVVVRDGGDDRLIIEVD